MRQQIRIIISNETHNWIEDNIVDIRSGKHSNTPFRWRIEYMITNGIKPPVFDTSTNEHSINVSISYLALENIKYLSGKSWAEKFKTFLGVDYKSSNATTRSYYVKDADHGQLLRVGNGNASKGIGVLCERSIVLTYTQRLALELLGDGDINKGLASLIGK